LLGRIKELQFTLPRWYR